SIRARFPPLLNEDWATFGPTSVVRIACENASMPPGDKRDTESGNAAVTFLSGSTTPITPVDARKISSTLQRRSCAARERTRFAASSPGLPVTALAQPALTTTAFTRPPLFLSDDFASTTGAA